MAILYTLCFSLIFNSSVSFSQENQVDPVLHVNTNVDKTSQGSQQKIQLKVSDPIPAVDVSEDHIAKDATLLMLTPEFFKKIRHRLDEKLWSPIKVTGAQVFGFVTVNTPKMLKTVVAAFRDPLASTQNVTIVTTIVGTVSSIVTFTFGNVIVNEASLTRLVSMGILIICFSGYYRYNYDKIGAFLNYRGWSLKKINRNAKLQNLYEENIKKLKDEKPEGLTPERFIIRMAKVALLECLFLTTIDSWDFIFPKGEITSKFLLDFAISTFGYTMVTFSDAAFSRKMIEEKISVESRDPVEIENEHNKIAFKYKALSIAVTFIQNLMIIPAIAGSNYFQAALLSIGAAVITYEFAVTRSPIKMSCSKVFAE